jgi:hypothetical protein
MMKAVKLTGVMNEKKQLCANRKTDKIIREIVSELLLRGKLRTAKAFLRNTLDFFK